MVGTRRNRKSSLRSRSAMCSIQGSESTTRPGSSSGISTGQAPHLVFRRSRYAGPSAESGPPSGPLRQHPGRRPDAGPTTRSMSGTWQMRGRSDKARGGSSGDRNGPMGTSNDLEMTIKGLWAIHPSRATLFGTERFRRRPKSHIEFYLPGWRLYETGWRRRFPHAGTSQGVWRILALDGAEALLVLTVQSYRPSRLAHAALESNYSYSGGAMVVAGGLAQREKEAKRMRDGKARMYFTPVTARADEIVMALPTRGRKTLRERWVRLEQAA